MQSRPSDLPEHTPPAHERSESSRSQASAAQRHPQQPFPGPPESTIPRPPFPRPAHPHHHQQQQLPPPTLPRPQATTVTTPSQPPQPPQTLQPQPLAHPGFATTSSTTSSPAKRRRTSFGPSVRDLDPESVNVPAGASSTSTTTTPSRPSLLNPAPVPASVSTPAPGGSSREAVSEMQRSSTPPDTSSTGTIKYTRTGRVSKATKGQRVHHCEECGKTYTRAEHLRRHQQNHKPGGFPCDVPGCDRSFYREDLLIRHKARHNDPQNPPSRRPSVGSESAEGRPRPIPPSLPTDILQPLSRAQPAPAPLVHPQPPAASNNGGGRQPDKRGSGNRVPVPPYQLERGNIAISSSLLGGDAGGVAYEMIYDGSSPTSPSGPGGYESPDESPPLPYWSSFGRNPSYYGYPPSGPPVYVRSPVSVGSSNAYSSPFSLGVQRPVMLDVCENPAAWPGSSYNYAEYRDAQERSVLCIPKMAPSILDDRRGSADSSGGDEDQYLEAYWNSIHRFFPVVHKPTFHAATASPLLHAAMTALGGQALCERGHLSNARLIHDRCMKVLKSRDVDNTHTWRIQDMQAILLIEVYYIFRSRRPPLQFSRNFEEVYSRLVNDPQAWEAMRSDDDVRYSGGYVDEHGGRHLETETKQRLLLACYTLDQQHAALFGRMQMELSRGAAPDLPFPSSQAQWSASDDTPVEFGQRRGSSLTYCERVSDAMRPVPSLSAAYFRPHDTFQSLVMIACMVDPTHDMPTRESPSPSGTTVNTLSHAIEQSSWTRLAFHTLELCRQTPVRDLLAVAGESWVMAEKLSSAEAYTKAQLELRHWALGSSSARQTGVRDVRRALSHAFSIFDIVKPAVRTGLIFQEWAIYLASVVVWAQQYVLTADARQPPSSPTSPQGALPSATELDQKMSLILRNGVEALSGWRDTRNILMWTKRRTESVEAPHTCGLISGALDVLRKLINQGNEEDWF